MPTQKKSQQGEGQAKERTEQSESESESESDLKEREYRGADGQIHHHTKKYMEQHQGEQGKKGKEE